MREVTRQNRLNHVQLIALHRENPLQQHILLPANIHVLGHMLGVY